MSKIAPLSSRALLRLEGADVVGFLQNLITNDVENLTDGQASFAALLTPQGKVLFDFIVLREGNGFTIDIDRQQRDSMAKLLTFYKLRADVQISNDERGVIAGWPDLAAMPSAGFADPRHDGLGWRLFDNGPETNSDANSDESAWHENRIAVGIPQSGEDFELGEVFPHDILLDQLHTGGIDFSKGCYVGQEVVSRMQHRGTARNRFVIAKASNPLPADARGATLTADGKRVGTLGSFAGKTGLALVRVDRIGSALEAGTAIMAGDMEVTLEIPSFANFGWGK
ncbi:MAG: folate-binding protein YgfZ [Rhizobiaceae bacterium]